MIETVFAMPQWITDLNINYQYPMGFIVFCTLWGWDIITGVLKADQGYKVDIEHLSIGAMVCGVIGLVFAWLWPYAWPLFALAITVAAIGYVMYKIARLFLLSGARKK